MPAYLLWCRECLVLCVLQKMPFNAFNAQFPKFSKFLGSAIVEITVSLDVAAVAECHKIVPFQPQGWID